VKRRLVVALLVGIVGVAMYAGNVLATPQTGVTTTQLVKQPFGLIDLYVVRNTFAPGGQTGWHTHPGRSFVIVTKGRITAYDGDDPTCTPMVYTAGEGFVDRGNGHVHLLWNRSDKPAETVAVQMIAKGAPRRIDEPSPGNCAF
jgi:quercetin dioxygenase-like cupin family protein